jgi:hypothetical protein
MVEMNNKVNTLTNQSNTEFHFHVERLKTLNILMRAHCSNKEILCKMNKDKYYGDKYNGDKYNRDNKYLKDLPSSYSGDEYNKFLLYLKHLPSSYGKPAPFF